MRPRDWTNVCVHEKIKASWLQRDREVCCGFVTQHQLCTDLKWNVSFFKSWISVSVTVSPSQLLGEFWTDMKTIRDEKTLKCGGRKTRFYSKRVFIWAWRTFSIAHSLNWQVNVTGSHLHWRLDHKPVDQRRLKHLEKTQSRGADASLFLQSRETSSALIETEGSLPAVCEDKRPALLFPLVAVCSSSGVMNL